MFALDARAARAWCTTSAFQPGDWLVFGSETRGLAPALRESFPPAQRLRLPMREGQRSLNLSNAVAVTVFEAWRQNGFGGPRDSAGATDSAMHTGWSLPSRSIVTCQVICTPPLLDRLGSQQLQARRASGCPPAPAR